MLLRIITNGMPIAVPEGWLITIYGRNFVYVIVR